VPRLLLLLVLALIGPALARTSTVAVSDLAPQGIEASEAAVLSERLRAELIGTGAFQVMERSQMDQILKEQAFQQSGACDQSGCAVEIGKLLSVERIVVGSVGRIGGLYSVQLRLLDVRTGSVLSSVGQDRSGRTEDLLNTTVPELAKRLAETTGWKRPASASRLWLRWGSAAGAVGAATYGVVKHMAAADEKATARKAVKDYQAATSDFDRYREINAQAVKKANAATTRAVVGDAVAGLLAGLFTLTFVF